MTDESMLVGIGCFMAYVVYRHCSSSWDGFVSNSNSNRQGQEWPLSLVNRFLQYQQTMNDNQIQFNLLEVQRQATAEEAEHLLATGVWPWSDELKQLYVDQVWANPMIKIDPELALQYAMATYNQTAAHELLAWNSKEGQFLLRGVNIGHTEGMPSTTVNTIQCSNTATHPRLQKQVFTQMNTWNGHMDYTLTDIDPNDIPHEVKGFAFLREPCNPCVAIDANYSCPFSLTTTVDANTKNPSPSQPTPSWAYLWNKFNSTSRVS